MHQQFGSISFISAHSGFSDLQSCSIIKGKNYYIAKSIDSHPELIQKLFQTNSLAKSPNIFQDPVNLKIVEHDPTVGPKYQNNKILSRSIVGKPEIFKKKQPTQHQEFMMPTSQANLGESTILKKESPIQRRLTLMKIAQSPIKYSKPSKNEKVITGNELISKINTLEKRLISNQLEEKKSLSSLPFEQKQALFREQRALENFDEKEKLQAHILQSLSARLSRDPNQSLMVDLYKFRRKLEYTSTNEKMRQVSEYNGNKIIEVKEENQVPFFICSDRQMIIRKPPVLSKDAQFRQILKKKNEEKVFSASSLYQYLDEKEKKYKPLVQSKIHTNLEELVIQGQSKYDSETSVNPNQKYLIKELEQQKPDEENDLL